RDTRTSSGSIYLGLSVVLLLASGGLLGGYLMLSSESPVASAEAAATLREPGSAGPGAVQDALERLLDQEIRVRIGAEAVTLRWRVLGVSVDPQELAAAARRADPADVLGSLASAGMVPLGAERERVAAALADLKARYDIAPQDARMDLENHTIHESRDGVSLDVYGSIGAVIEGARAGAQ